MRLLLDTHLLLWAAAGDAGQLSAQAIRLIEDADNELFFSAASLWEIAIKRSRRRSDFEVDPRELRLHLFLRGYAELPVTGEHALAVPDLPTIHKDPFDRMLVAQSRVEGITLVTADPLLASYSPEIRQV